MGDKQRCEKNEKRLFDGVWKALAISMTTIDGIILCTSLIYYFGIWFLVSIGCLLLCKVALFLYMMNTANELYDYIVVCKFFGYSLINILITRCSVCFTATVICHVLVCVWRTACYPDSVYYYGDTRTILFFTAIAIGYIASFVFFVAALILYFYFRD